jgi:hypothetical protein
MSGQEAQEPAGSADHPLVKRYLKDLEGAARMLPRARRAELLQDVRSHIEVALAEQERPDDAAVREVLAGLGAPPEIVTAALADGEPVGPEAPAVTVGITGHEVAAVVLLLFGALALGFGWLAGVLLLWSSPRWTRRDKLLGTFVVPGGVVAPLIVVALTASGPSAGLAVLLILAAAASATTAFWLVSQARTAAVAEAPVRWGPALWAVGGVMVVIPLIVVVFMMTSTTEVGTSTPVSVTATLPSPGPTSTGQ